MRERRFVDLYAVVRGGVLASEPDYSIKSLEVFTGIERAGDVKTAGGSVVAYERWLEERDDAILAEIEDYNRIDCVSTAKLRDWLAAIRPEGPWPALAADRSGDEAQEDAEAAELRAELAASCLDPERQRLLFDLGFFHRREAKPAYWAIFDSLGRDTDELIGNLDCLGGLEAMGPARREKRSAVRDYRYPEQESRLKPGSQPTAPLADPYVSLGLAALDRGARTATVKVGADRGIVLPDRLSLHPPRPLDSRSLAGAVRDVIADQCGPRRFRALDDLLARRAPRLGAGPTDDILAGEDPVAGTVRAVLGMRGSILPIQGPPGTGKTSVAARAILALVAAGRRVAVASTSHEAIGNVLRACLEALPRRRGRPQHRERRGRAQARDRRGSARCGLANFPVAPAQRRALAHGRRGRRHRLPLLPPRVRGRLRHPCRRRGGPGRPREPAGHGALRPQHRAGRRSAPAAAACRAPTPAPPAFDIGGGTVDGVAFNFVVEDGRRRVNFYSGKVDAVGMAVSPRQRGDIKYPLQRLVANVIVTARQKDGRDWRCLQQAVATRILGRLDPVNVPPLIVFLGGYGAGDNWYRKTIKATYVDFRHDRAGIPPYGLNTVPTPPDLALSPDDEFARFAIAYGLSVPFGEGPEVALPSEVQARPAPMARASAGVDYMDSKDAFD